ncbi:hypothetical protein QBC37DRAFT_375154 [Rhypophila decipiens]|uniref:Uncharacterized protein n=1 Tax=Rhypophila decipiens TaxID=261697 RepID=A0AAN7B4B7_9PEZI|nr:hypothetical protein QBC37DRAFT_375154 [Rhypophila decipiens]
MQPLLRLMLVAEAIALAVTANPINATGPGAAGDDKDIECGPLLAARDDPIDVRVRWTLDRTCTHKVSATTLIGDARDGEKEEAVYRAVMQAIERSDLAKRTIMAWKTDCPGYGAQDPRRRQCELLMGPVDNNWVSKCDTVIKHFDAAGRIETPPVGFGGDYANSQEWVDLGATSETHHLNFIVYCAPSLSQKPVPRPSGGEAQYDFARKKWTEDHPDGPSKLVLMYNEATDTKNWPKAPENMDMDGAITAQDPDPPVTSDRRRVAATLTIHPLYLASFFQNGEWGGTSIDDHSFYDWVDVTLDENDDDMPIESFATLSATIHHEFFHLRAIGNLFDHRGASSYGFQNMLAHKDETLPELYKFLGLQTEFFSRGLAVNEDGTISELP